MEQVARRRGSRPRVEIQRERKLSIPHLPLPAHTLGSRALGRTPSLTDGADGDTFTPARHAHKTRTHGHRTMPRACVFLQQAASSKQQAASAQQSEEPLSSPPHHHRLPESERPRHPERNLPGAAPATSPATATGRRPSSSTSWPRTPHPCPPSSSIAGTCCTRPCLSWCVCACDVSELLWQ